MHTIINIDFDEECEIHQRGVNCYRDGRVKLFSTFESGSLKKCDSTRFDLSSIFDSDWLIPELLFEYEDVYYLR